MKFSTVMLTAAFIGIVSALGPAGGLPNHLRHMRLSHDSLQGGLFLHLPTGTMNPKIDASSGELLELKKREAALRAGVHEAESALRQVESSERYLKSRLKALTRERGCSRRFDGDGGSKETAIHQHLKALEGEKAVFNSLIAELENEQVALKIKMDLWSVESKKIAIINLLEKKEGERSPVEGLSEQARNEIHSRRTDHGISY